MVPVASLLLVLGLSAPRLAPIAEDRHPFTIHDMLAMERISDPQVSPDGKWVAYTVRTTDLDANRGRNDVWVSAVDGSSAKQLTVHEASDSSARWMPDGRSLVFLSSRSGSSQVWRIAVDGGEAEQLTKLPIGVDGVLPFPDGERLLLTMEVYADAPKETALADTAKRDEAAEKNPVKARTYETLLFRHWDTWEDGKRSHVFAWKIGGGDPVDLMPGFDGDSPTKPFGGIEEVAISPDGREVAFTAIEMKTDAAWTTDADVWTVPADASAAPQCRTTDNLAMDTQPAYSPDGRTLAWLAMERPGYEADRYRIVLHDRQGGKSRVLTQDFDRSCSSIVWSGDSKTIWTTADNLGNHSLFAVDAGNGAPRVLVEKGTNASPCPAG